MATRRPNMPRVRPADQGHGATAANEGENAAAPAANTPAAPRTPTAVNRQKVVPMGAAPAHEEAPRAASSRPEAASASAAGKPATKKPAAKKPSAGKPASQPAAKKPAASASTAKKQPGTPPTKKPNQPGKRPGPRQGGPREKRLRERAELSGAIRSGSGHRKPEAAQTPAEGGAPVPARAFSGRLLTLAVILAVVTVLLLPSVGTYMDQRAEVAEVQASIAQKQQEQDELVTQISRWDDPAYVKAQARNRINLVMPGEKKYMVVGATGEESAAGPQSVGDVRTDLPWVDSLWDTVVRSATD
ncbi:septum formation initiator family protein [Arthrobacter rhombi]|uniref:septum formation initiator family protein n=1 Tax=Arthrobacter rhombi TaxID=71253 RepID=UPI003FD365CE